MELLQYDVDFKNIYLLLYYLGITFKSRQKAVHSFHLKISLALSSGNWSSSSLLTNFNDKVGQLNNFEYFECTMHTGNNTFLAKILQNAQF